MHSIKVTTEFASAHKKAAQEFIKKFAVVTEQGIILPMKFFMLMRKDYFGKCLYELIWQRTRSHYFLVAQLQSGRY